jgi:predicted Ser/Thr protein kinase
VPNLSSDDLAPDASGKPAAPAQERTGVIGHSLGGCTVLSKLGEGGMGAVFMAHDPGLDRKVAIKILPPSLAREDAYRERFLREARALARVKHQNLVQVYSVAVEKGVHFFSMEYIDGDSLQQRLRREGPMLLEQILSVAGQVLSAIGAIHAQGITHRDIKSSNIMIDRAGRAVLMDLGLAKEHGATGVTTAGVIIGTPEFMSPEQAMGEAAGPLSDIYSFGVVLYELSTGVVPFRGKSAVAVLRMQCENEPEPLARVRPDLPTAFVEAVQAAMKKDPAARPQGAGRLAEMLAACGTTPELAALATGPSVASGLQSRAQTKVDRAIHSAPTLQVNGSGERPAASDRPFWMRGSVLVAAAIVLVLIAGYLRARQTVRRSRPAPEGAVATRSVQPVRPSNAVTVFVGGKDYFPGRTAVLIDGGLNDQEIRVMLDNGSEKRIPLVTQPEIRYVDRPRE